MTDPADQDRSTESYDMQNLRRGEESLKSRVVGPYKLLQKIGEGGMGDVWMAEQQRPVRRQVALKLIKAGHDTKEIVARFEAERQALAMMDHQNIARVLDAGITEDGRPYFAMELVQGIPITEYCDKNRLTPVERLELFIPVCQAIQHAHQKGIIHRDIKPSNVLVTLYDRKPVAKVIDFGLAKALNQAAKLTDKTLFTEFGKVVGTLNYMSPEQTEMNALSVDTRTDIYSLGVLLYELLTGSTPLEKETAEEEVIFKLLEIIREREPQRPSNRLSESADKIAGISDQRHIDAKKLLQMLRGDLDWIVMKTLEKDRTRRYETAAALADDVQRFLKQEPVVARPPSAVYRVRKLIRRHRVPVIATGLLMLAVAMGIVGIEYQRREAIAAKDRAFAAETETRLQADIAQQEAKRATENERRALDYADSVRRIAYANDIQLAAALRESRDPSGALAILERCPQDLRGWEWHWLTRASENWVYDVKASDGPVNALAISPDDSMFATVSGDASICLWSVLDGKLHAPLSGCSQGYNSVAFGKDGRRLIAGAADGRVCAWDTTTRKLLFETSELQAGVVCLVFSPDGQTIATGSEDGIIRIRDASTGAERSSHSAHEGAVLSLCYSRDGTTLLSSGHDKRIKSHDVALDGQAVRGFNNGGSPKYAAFFRRDREVVTADSVNGRARRVTNSDDASHVMGHGYRLKSGARGLAISGDQLTFATIHADSSVRVWRAPSWYYGSAVLQGVSCLALSRGGRWLILGGNDGHVRVFDTAASENPDSIRVGNMFTVGGSFAGASIGLDGSRLAMMATNGMLGLFDIERNEVEFHPDIVDRNLALAFSRDGASLFGISQRDGIWTYGVDERRLDLTPVSIAEPLTCAEFDPHSERLAIGTQTGRLHVIDLAAKSVEYQLAIDSGPIECIAFDGDGTTLACGARSGKAHLVNARTGTKVYSIEAHRGAVTAVAFSRNCKLWATGGEDRQLKLWTTVDGKELCTLTGLYGAVRAIAISADGSRVFSGGDDSRLRVWDTVSKRELIDITMGDPGNVVFRILFPNESDVVFVDRLGVHVLRTSHLSQKAASARHARSLGQAVIELHTEATPKPSRDELIRAIEGDPDLSPLAQRAALQLARQLKIESP